MSLDTIGLRFAERTALSPLDPQTPPDARAASLGGLADVDGELAARIAQHSVSVVLPRGAAWRAEARLDAALLAVEDGFLVASSTVAGPLARRVVLTTARPGMLLTPPVQREWLEAVTPARFTTISTRSLKALLGHAAAAELIAEMLVDALREREATIRNCSYVRHAERVREKLLQLGRIHGRAVPGGVRIDFPLTHQLLADMVGSARETVSLALAELARDGFVHRQQRRYLIRIGAPDLLDEAC
jgi:CRP-like cAMP-binding protein